MYIYCDKREKKISLKAHTELKQIEMAYTYEIHRK